MKQLFFISLVLITFGCKPSISKPENTTTPVTATSDTSAITTQADTATETKVAIPCDMKGKLIEKFEQNNALFERLSNEEKELEWLRITTKDGKCTILDDIKTANHYSVSFEDWDKDGYKDRINNWKWDYEVHLFDKTKNDFSRHINGRFNGDQWDFDKAQNLKFQFLENKYGGVYELYSLKGNVKTVHSEILLSNAETDGEDYKIEIRKNIVQSNDAVAFDTLKVDSKLLAETRSKANEDYEKQSIRTKKAVEAYWRKNLSLFLKK
jgi:hypothetical protein